MGRNNLHIISVQLNSARDAKLKQLALEAQEKKEKEKQRQNELRAEKSHTQQAQRVAANLDRVNFDPWANMSDGWMRAYEQRGVSMAQAALEAALRPRGLRLEDVPGMNTCLIKNFYPRLLRSTITSHRSEICDYHNL